MRVFIEPLDVLFFRDGKPFTAGESHLANCLFPPTPMTFQGAIRSKILTEKGVDFESYAKYGENASKELNDIVDEIGSPKKYGRLRLKGPFLAKKNNARIIEYFSAPQDIVLPRQGENQEILQLQPLKEVAFSSDLSAMEHADFHPLWGKTSFRVETAQGFLDDEQFKLYLEGKVPTSLVSQDAIMKREYRVGIKHETKVKVVEEGMLYSAEFIRLESGVGFTLDMENISLFPSSGVFSLGGEQRAATFEVIQSRNFDCTRIKDIVKKTKKFKLNLATPAFFDNGWLPDFVNSKSLRAEVGDLKFQLVSAAVGRPMPLGGWDLVSNRPKEMKYTVPAGSVYFFELIEGDIEKLFETFWFSPISSEHSEVGFGVTFIGGGWDYV